jgi:hypothetical protein
MEMGVNQLAADVAEAMERLAEAFESERQQRIKPDDEA